jgi:Na+-driven multidrug efflux pump
MKKPLLISSVILILMSLVHVVWGRENFLNEFSDDQTSLQLIATISWYQSAGVLFLMGVFLGLQAMRGIQNRTFILFALLSLVSNILIFAIFAIINDEAKLLLSSFPQLVTFSVVIGLLVYTIRVKPEISLS